MTIRLIVSALALVLCSAAWAKDTSSDWTAQSNKIAYRVLESSAKFAPEFAGQTGVDGYDEEIFDLGPNLTERQIANAENNIKMLKKELAAPPDPRIAQDIEIMIQSARDTIESTRINYERVMPYRLEDADYVILDGRGGGTGAG